MTEDQARFARAHNARPGARAAGAVGSVYMYREDERGAHRWLVSPSGRVLDETSFEDRY